MKSIISRAGPMHNPPHPGKILKTLCLEPLGITITDAADALGVSRKTLSAILNGRARITPEMAVRLSMAFNTTAESWLTQQTLYDLWHAEQQRAQLKVRRLAQGVPSRLASHLLAGMGGSQPQLRAVSRRRSVAQS